MSYIRNAWYVAAWAHDIKVDVPSAIMVLGERIVVWRSASGQVHALEDRCVHRFAPLSLGRCEGERLRCMYHGFLFDTAGKVVEIPGQDVIPPAARVKSYLVVARHSWIWIWMGDAALADEELIPVAVGLDDPDYILGHGKLDYAAEARLINDNLLDFSHLTFVHGNSFGSGPEFADTQARITPLSRGIRYERWTENAIGSGSLSNSVPTDNYMQYDFLIPGILLMTVGSFPLGTAKACNHGMPDYGLATGGVTHTNQAVTPKTDKTAQYLFSWGPHRSHGDEALRDFLMGVAAQAFEEDRVMIEAQQRVIDTSPVAHVIPTSNDRGVVLYNRLVERMARAEAAAQPAPAEPVAA